MAKASASIAARPIRLTKLLISLLAAALFWMMNALNRDYYSLNLEYPIRFIYNESLFIPTTPLPKTITVNVSGVGWDLLGHSVLTFRTNPVDYSIRNPLRTSVINTSTLAAAFAEQIKDVRINYVVADTLEIKFDKRVTKTIQVEADSARINMAPRFVITSLINITPSQIQVSGPAGLVNGLPDTVRVFIPNKRIAENFDEEVTVSAFRHPLLQTSTDQVFVSFEVAELLSPLPPPAPTSASATGPATKTQTAPTTKARTNRPKGRGNKSQ